MAADAQINDSFFSELGHSPAVTALCVQKAEEVAAIARASGPKDTNDYVNSIRVEVVSGATRNTARVIAGDRKSMIIESKTGNLARALNQVKKSG